MACLPPNVSELCSEGRGVDHKGSGEGVTFDIWELLALFSVKRDPISAGYFFLELCPECNIFMGSQGGGMEEKVLLLLKINEASVGDFNFDYIPFGDFNFVGSVHEVSY